MIKIILRVTIAMALLLTMCGIVMAAPLTQSITYQGTLMNSTGNPLTGTYSMTFRLYNVPSGGSALATDTHSIQASNGLFTTNITFSQNLYDGQALWLGISVGADPEMTPRQEIQPVPYSLSLRPGAKITGSFSGFILDVINNGGAFSPALHAKTMNTNSSGVTVETTGAFSPALNANTTNTSSPGVFSITTGAFSPGVAAKTRNTSSPGILTETTGAFSDGVYVKTMNTNSSGISAETTGVSSPAVNANTANTNSPGVYLITAGTFSPGVAVKTMNTNSPGIFTETTGSNSFGVYASTIGNGTAGIYTITKGDFSNGVFANTTGIGSMGVVGKASGINSAGVWAESQNATALWADTGRSDQMYGIQTPDFMIAARYDVGSTDIAEYMPVTEKMTPGTVLVIGSEGKLQTSSTAYDTRVAGIISTEPGMSLGIRDNGNPGEALIAVAGRVPCNVDASNGPIHPGDLLTTSNTPGHAMKAIDPKIGTILGKALGSLESGTGMVDVLVTLQ